MTDDLQTLMRERADSVDFAAPDLDAMVRTGDRRRRTRSAAAVVGVAAASVLTVAGVQAVLPEPTSRVQPTAPVTPTSAPVSWVMGSVLHEGDRSHPLEFQPRAYVRTAEGYVLADGDGTVWSWVDGRQTEIGTTDPRDLRLVADDESGLAGWQTPSGRYVVLDQTTGRVSEHGTGPGPFAAIDDGRAYWRADRGPVVVDLKTGDQTRVRARGTRLGDLEDDLVAIPGDRGVDIETVSGDPVLEVTDSFADLGYLSPTARYYTWDADEAEVRDVRSGDRLPLDVGGRGFATGYEWLGPNTLAVLASAEPEDASTAELLVCELPGGSCSPVTELGTFDSIVGSLVLPVGIPLE